MTCGKDCSCQKMLYIQRECTNHTKHKQVRAMASENSDAMARNGDLACKTAVQATAL